MDASRCACLPALPPIVLLKPCCLLTCSMDTWMYLTRHLEPNEEVMVVAYGPYRLQLTAPAIPIVQVQSKRRRSLLDTTTVECAGGKQQPKPAKDIEQASRHCENTPGEQQAHMNMSELSHPHHKLSCASWMLCVDAGVRHQGNDEMDILAGQHGQCCCIVMMQMVFR